MIINSKKQYCGFLYFVRNDKHILTKKEFETDDFNELKIWALDQMRKASCKSKVIFYKKVTGIAYAKKGEITEDLTFNCNGL